MRMRVRRLALMGTIVGGVCLLPQLLFAQNHDNKGFIYGKVTTRGGTEYSGALRWGNQEAFWDDIFNSTKENNPYLEDLDEEDRRGSHIKIFKWKVRVDSDSWTSSRPLYCRFGDIASMEVRDKGEAELTMRSGSVYRVQGGGDDVESKIQVTDPAFGEIELHWDRIDTIEFMPTPSSIHPDGERLYGKMYCEAGDYEGFVQWDAQECLTTDKLDGESRDGDMSIAMGQIQSIERRNRRSATVVLKDGREVDLRDTNDVNEDNRGIYIETENQGRLRVHWDEFDKLEFLPARGSGKGYNDYPKPYRISGTVTDIDDRTYTGPLVIDLDEAESWEILNGERYGVEFYLPLDIVAWIEPDGRDGSMVGLTSGERLDLEDGNDVNEENAGLLVFEEGDDDPLYIDWMDIVRIELTR